MILPFTLGLFAVFLAPAPQGPAASSDISKMLAAGRKAVAAKDCATALTHFQAALEAAEKSASDIEQKSAIQQEALKEIAECHTYAGNWDAAETALWRRKDALAAWNGPREIELGHNYQSLAYIQIQRERWTFAESYAREALASYNAALAAPQRALSTPAKKATKASRESRDAIVGRSKVAAFYTLGLALALQRRTDDAFKTWEEGYLLGDRFTPKPQVMMQIAIQAIELHDMTNRSAGRPVWVDRLRALRARSP